jgi:hypothetical protein
MGDTNGWIKLHRIALDHGWLRDPKLWTVWSYCLLRASHKEHKQIVGRQEIMLMPGQFIFGRFEAARELRMKPSTLYDILTRVKEAGSIDIKSGNKFSVITVVNWEFYQGKQDEDRQQNRHETGSKPAQTRMEEGKKDTLLSPEGSGNDNCPHKEIVCLYHEILSALPGVRDWHAGRQKKLKARWSDDSERQSLDWWRDFFLYVKKCPHLIGDNDRGWKPNLEWLVERKNFVKIIEGSYEQNKKRMVRQ